MALPPPSVFLLTIRIGKSFFFLVLALLFHLNPAHAQEQSRVDSLKNLLLTSSSSVSKFQALKQIQFYYFDKQTDSVEKYIHKLLDFVHEENNPDYILDAEFNLGNFHYYQGHTDKATMQYQKVLDLGKEYGNTSYASICMLNLSLLRADSGDYEQAIHLSDSAIKFARRDKNANMYSQAMNVKGRHLFDIGSYSRALEYFSKVIQVLDSIDADENLKQNVLTDIGQVHLRQKNYRQSIKTFESLKSYYKANDANYSTVLSSTFIGDGYYGMKDYESALVNYQEAYDLANASGLSKMSAKINTALGKTYLAQGDFPSAAEYLKKTITNDSLITKKHWVEGVSYLGKALSQQGKLDEALYHLNSAVTKADSMGVSKELGEALLNRSLLFERKGQLKNALVDLRRYQIINDSVFTDELSKQINELQVAYETEVKEAEIAIQQEEIKTLNEQVKVDKLVQGLYAGGMFTFIACSGLLFFGYRQRMKKNRIAREKQEEIYKQEIAHKKKELASQTLHLVQKNTFIRELQESLENVNDSPEKFKAEFRRIVMLLKKENASNKDWEVFKTYFSDVHDDFDQKLKTFSTDHLSEKEMRLAAFLRMNLTTKEIAATMNILPESILTSKYRLKKKLGLEKETDLTSFLGTL